MLLPRYSPQLIPLDGYTRSASAIMLAVERIGRENMLNDVNFTFVWKFEECNEHTALGLAVQLILNDSINLLVGPPCNAPAIDVGILTAYYDIPNFLWGPTTASELGDLTRYPTVATVTPDSFSLGLAICATMQQYNWTVFGVIYASANSGTGSCYYLQQDLESALSLFPSTLSLVYTRVLPINVSNFTSALDELRLRVRIVVICLETDSQKWQFMEEVKRKGMSTPEYVYIFPDSSNTGFGKKTVKQGLAATTLMAHQMMQRAQIILKRSSMRLLLTWVFQAAQYAGSLYDTMYLYALALNRSLAADPVNGWRSGAKLLDYAIGSFNGEFTSHIKDGIWKRVR
ncbi:unnamed protein product [Toxocara canis]|uniref:ANF_receptor domain-containing protein n=1 Tax=Toxocara canis TaxID=6265 RepID=A0A183TWL5_TOXCA|nr:unnamed protein product [Toxocara canis]